MVTGSLLLAGTVIAGGAWAASRSGLIETVNREAMRVALDTTSRAGMVVEEIFARGRHRTSGEEVIDQLENCHRQNILTVDIDRAREQLESLPWVRSASLRRLLPNALMAQIVEHRPLALWQHGGAVNLVSDAGEIIPVDDLSPFGSLPVIAGEGAPTHAASLFAMLASEPSLARRVTGAQMVRERRWNVFVDGKVEVRLPAEGAREAWHRLAENERTTALLGRAIAAIDLRNPDWFVVKLAEELIEPTGGRAI